MPRSAKLLVLGAAAATLAIYGLSRKLSGGPASAAPSGPEPVLEEPTERLPPAQLVEPAPARPPEAQTPALVESPPEQAAASVAGERRSVGAELRGVRGRVLDARTGEPVPELRVSLFDGQRTETDLLTDDQGHFESGARFDHASLQAGFFDQLAQADAIERLDVRSAPRNDDELWTFSVNVGPTIRWLPATPIDPRARQGRARIVETSADGSRLPWPWKSVPWRTAPDAAEHALVRYERDLRRGGATAALEVHLSTESTQLGAVDFELQPGFEMQLSLEPMQAVPAGNAGGNAGGSAGGSAGPRVDYRGSAPLQSLVGVHPGIVLVELSEQLTLSGRCVDPEARPLAGLQVSVLRLDASDDRSPEESWTGRSDEQGLFAAGPLVAGNYRIVTLSRDHIPAEALLELWVGQQSVGDLVVEPLVIGGDVAGSVRYQGSLQDHVAVVRIVSRGRFPYDQIQFIDVQSAVTPDGGGGGRSDGDAGQASFLFQDVPQGEYDVTLVTVPELPIRPRTQRASPPCNDLAFEVDALVEGSKVGFEVFDAATGERIESFSALFNLGDRPLPTMRRCTFGEGEWKLSDGSGLQWWIEADGYRPASGDERAFARTGDPRLAVVRLEPGYTATLLFKDASPLYETHFDAAGQDELAIYSAPPIAGVRVIADGRTVTESDETGLAIVSLAEVPQRIEVRHPRWRVLESSTLVDGRVSKHRTPTVVWMLP